MIPGFVREAFEKKVWQQERMFAGGTVHPPVTFKQFVHDAYPAGLGSDYATVRRWLVEDAATLAMWDEAVAGDNRPGQRTDLLYNVQEVEATKAPTGNTSSAAIRRLRKA